MKKETKAHRRTRETQADKEMQAIRTEGDVQAIPKASEVRDRGLLPNREYKSTIFSLLFKDKRKLLTLYNGLNHSHYQNPEELIIVTLENAIYMAMKNDVAFLLEHRLNLYEYQSTPNPNLPLRDLFYVSREYEKLVAKRSLYGRRKVKIPAPRFVVFYNGAEKQPERQLLKLSDLYEVAEESPMLELLVEVLNINHGYNRRLKEECRSLGEYMEFVDRIRRYTDEENKPLEEAVEQAVTECIREGVLAEFLEANRREVVAMSIFEYDEERELKLLRQAEYELGVEDGERIGQQRGERMGREKGLKALVNSLRTLLPNFEAVYQAVTANEEYKTYTREQVGRYY